MNDRFYPSKFVFSSVNIEMSAKQREEVLCKLCGEQVLLKNLKIHHERNHDSTQTMGYTLLVDPKQ